MANNLAHPPNRQARAKLRAMSADEEARYWAEAREKALRDEITMLGEAHDQGFEEGRELVARNLVKLNLLTDQKIGEASGLMEDEVTALRQIVANESGGS